MYFYCFLIILQTIILTNRTAALKKMKTRRKLFIHLTSLMFLSIPLMFIPQVFFIFCIIKIFDLGTPQTPAFIDYRNSYTQNQYPLYSTPWLDYQVPYPNFCEPQFQAVAYPMPISAQQENIYEPARKISQNFEQVKPDSSKMPVKPSINLSTSINTNQCGKNMTLKKSGIF